ncbi:hypothetical protein GUITHDRAFT_135671 [Guillardia theta CCMP2712]|uniref:Heterokaryon incompatibility domain-containing protein n=2 Tax=Guillardia theta TaxID=55529 RepID=L1JNX5_GUITC|nr:hypothetical protein GUITHDRAFT_135671 [Guillardia theta CCMP2712]EKX49994.1 hypothetical protein GUITHDRAFT_135671 [Guillardia theta CCMP2712]|eukprot:XP_005836974.1 hypothetical protein GUITHDRAFT_135671 [Guillardia theta CCMP2712]
MQPLNRMYSKRIHVSSHSQKQWMYIKLPGVELSSFSTFIRGLTVVQLLLLLYFLLWSYLRGRCFRDLEGASKGAVIPLFYLSVGVFCFHSVWWTLLIFYKSLFGMWRQSVKEENRTALALCTSDLCDAQKTRIRAMNRFVDAAILLWLLLICAMTIKFFVIDNSQCIFAGDPTAAGYAYGANSCFSCDLQLYISAYAVWLGVSLGIILKTVVLSSSSDFTLKSKELENLTIKEWRFPVIGAWVQRTEFRQSIAVVIAGLGFIPFLVISLGAYGAVNPKRRYLFAPFMYTVTLVTALIDFGVLNLIFYPLKKILKRRKKDKPAKLPKKWSLSRKIFMLSSRPKRKVLQAFYLFMNIPWFGGCALSHLGALGQIYVFASILFFICFLLTCTIFIVDDKSYSVKDLLDRPKRNNYGLIMLRSAFVKELERILEESRESNFTHVVLQGEEDAAGVTKDDSQESGKDEGKQKESDAGDIQCSMDVPMYLASQDRVELAVVLSYRWSDRKLYMKKQNDPSSVPRCFRIRHSNSDGFDWVVTMIEPQLIALIKALSKQTEDYVWMDQFCIPQVNSSEAKDLEYEEKKREMRNILIPRMVALYSSAGVVLAFDNSGDTRLEKEDWYENRMWCLQEYTFPQEFEIIPISNEGNRDHHELLERRSTVNQMWFDEERMTQLNQVASLEEGMATRGQRMILDWVVKRKDNIEILIKNRVYDVGSRKYLELVYEHGASNRNDTLPALAQAWFGIIMTKPESKQMLIQSLVSHLFETGDKELDVIRNFNERTKFRLATGTMIADRMLSGQPAGLESGEETKVQMLCHGVEEEEIGSEDLSETLYSCKGQLIHPPRFKQWVTHLFFTRAEAVEGSRPPACRLYKMTVFNESTAKLEFPLGVKLVML